MEAALAESTALSSKSEREYITLRDTLKGMKAAWRADVDSLREDMRKREEHLRSEAETAGKKFAKLLEESKARKTDAQNVERLCEQHTQIRREVEEEFRGQISTLKKEVANSSESSKKAEKTAECVPCPFRSPFRSSRLMSCRHLAGELARLRRLMQSTSQSEPEDSPT
jgi:hypothetical protein